METKQALKNTCTEANLHRQVGTPWQDPYVLLRSGCTMHLPVGARLLRGTFWFPSVFSGFRPVPGKHTSDTGARLQQLEAEQAAELEEAPARGGTGRVPLGVS